ncbi:MAG: PIN domain-containing protein [Actinobacteria bacterium]|nr:PIN domain-containing protein [Actinomycetota bacterium]
MIVLADTSFLIAAVDKSDNNHLKAADYLKKNNILTYVIPLATVQEVCSLIGLNISKEVEILFLKEILKSFHIELIENKDIERAADILERYAALEIGFTDAVFIAVSERLKINNILTFDRKNFSKISPAGFKKFNILIE